MPAITLTTALAALALTGPGTPAAYTKHARPQPADDLIRNLYDFREMRADIEPSSPDALDELVATVLGQYVGIGHSEVMEGVYLVEGTPDQIDQADDMIRALRAAMGASFVVRLECWTLPSEIGVSLGQPLPPGGGRQDWYEGVVAGRRQTQVNSVTEHSYINEWSPVVSDSSVGYDPQSDTVSSGLIASILIGEQDGDMVRARISGSLTEVTMDERIVQLGDAQIPFTSPTVTRRTLLADASIPMGEDVVVQALPGLKPGTTLAVVVRVVATESVFVRRTSDAPRRPARP